MDAFVLIAGLLAYVIGGRLAMRGLTGAVRELMLAVLNVMGCYYFLFFSPTGHPALNFGILLALIAVFYLALHLFAGRSGGWPWLAFCFWPGHPMRPLRSAAAIASTWSSIPSTLKSSPPIPRWR